MNRFKIAKREKLDPSRLAEHLRKVFEEAGIKLTHQRLAIYQAIMDAKDHPSAETIFERLKGELPALSLDTVYRTLALFEQLGLIKRVHILDHARFDPDLTRHHHFVCKKCKKIIDFVWPDFDQMTLPDGLNNLGRPLEHQVEVRGICKECLKKERK